MTQMQPADVVNRAYDALGSTKIIGSIMDGTKDSEAARRAYGLTLRQLLRAANWNFARKQAALQLLGDASGQSDVSDVVEQPWLYAYAWPIDGVKARFVPWNNDLTNGGIPGNNTAIPPVPLTTDPNPAPRMARLIPTRFLVGSSDQYPVVIGQADWDNLPDAVEGAGPINRTIILSNVPQATLVYTRLVLDIEEWDPLFAGAMDATLAAKLAMVVVEDKKFARVLRDEQIAIAKEAIKQARIADGNEGWSTTDHMPDWITARSSSGYGIGWGGWGGFGAGVFDNIGLLWGGWDSMSFPDGSSF